MCFVAGWLETSSQPRLVLASNRDEFYNRQGELPAYRDEGEIGVVSPLDPRKGGTWFGFNDRGLIVALTNRLGENPKDEAPSRGQLVRTILSETSDRGRAIERYRNLKPHRYNPHRILLIDSSGVTTIRSSPGETTREDCSAGLFYLDNQSGFVDDQETLNDNFPVDLTTINESTFPVLEHFCSSHASFLERDSVCLHAGIAGTLSSSLLLVDPAREVLEYRFAQGAPCSRSFESVTIPESFRTNVLGAWLKTAESR